MNMYEFSENVLYKLGNVNTLLLYYKTLSVLISFAFWFEHIIITLGWHLYEHEHIPIIISLQTNFCGLAGGGGIGARLLVRRFVCWSFLVLMITHEWVDRSKLYSAHMWTTTKGRSIPNLATINKILIELWPLFT